MVFEQLISDVKELDVVNALVIKVEDIDFSEEVRRYCEINQCGKYGTNWACPPGVGPVSELKNNALKYNKGLLLQTVHKLTSSFDLKGMINGGIEHERIMRKVQPLLTEKYNLGETMLLGAGCCTLCEKCTFIDGEPCRFPDKALASVEAYGIDVMSLTRKYKIPYNHGTGTVAYVGLLLFTQN